MINYYDLHAQQFIENTFYANVEIEINNFCSQLPPLGKILDVGCGSGRDTQHFLNKNFEVVAFDSSETLANLASSKINHPVLVRTIEEMNWHEEFDGVWAMASLLHLTKENFPAAIQNCLNALKPNGLFFCSLKIGDGEGYDDKGRFFSYYRPDEISDILLKANINNFKLEVKEDTLGREGLSWISFIAHKNAPILKQKMKI